MRRLRPSTVSVSVHYLSTSCVSHRTTRQAVPHLPAADGDYMSNMDLPPSGSDSDTDAAEGVDEQNASTSTTNALTEKLSGVYLEGSLQAPALQQHVGSDLEHEDNETLS